MKLCRGCHRVLDESEFTVNRRAPDGLDWRCRLCKREQALRYLQSERGQQTRQAYYDKHKSDGLERRRERRKEYAEANQEEVRCRWLLGNAIRRGYIQRPNGGRNWRNNWEFHHPDHSRPYFGVWVSPSEHRLIDMGKAPCPPCADYTAQVRERVLADWGLSEKCDDKQ